MDVVDLGDGQAWQIAALQRFDVVSRNGREKTIREPWASHRRQCQIQ
jgi:hypothetical protein